MILQFNSKLDQRWCPDLKPVHRWYFNSKPVHWWYTDSKPVHRCIDSKPDYWWYSKPDQWWCFEHFSKVDRSMLLQCWLYAKLTGMLIKISTRVKYTEIVSLNSSLKACISRNNIYYSYIRNLKTTFTYWKCLNGWKPNSIHQVHLLLTLTLQSKLGVYWFWCVIIDIEIFFNQDRLISIEMVTFAMVNLDYSFFNHFADHD